MEEELFYFLLGAFAFYTWVHFYVFSFTKTWNDRSPWERFVTVISAVLFGFLLIGSM